MNTLTGFSNFDEDGFFIGKGSNDFGMTSTKVGMDNTVSLLCSGIAFNLVQFLVQRAFQEVFGCIVFPYTLVVPAANYHHRYLSLHRLP